VSRSKRRKKFEMELKKFERENPICEFSIPARPTVRQQMEYFSATAGVDRNQMLTRYWLGAAVLIQEWKCEAIPQIDVDLDGMTNPEQSELLVWAAMRVKSYMDKLENIPKN